MNWCLVASPKLCATVDSLTEAHVIPSKSPSICLQVRPWNLSFRSRCWSQQLRTRVLQAGNCLKAKTPRSWNNKRTIIWNINLYYFTIFLFYFLRLSPSNKKLGLLAHCSVRLRPGIAPEKSFWWKVAMANFVVVRSGMLPGSIDMHVAVYVHL